MNAEIARRHRTAGLGRAGMLASLVAALLALMALMTTIVNGVFGFVILRQQVDPSTLADRPLSALAAAELTDILRTAATTEDIDGLTPGVLRRLEFEKPFAERTQADVLQIVNERLVKQEIVRSYTLAESLLERARIEADITEQNAERKHDQPEARLHFRSWLGTEFLVRPMHSVPDLAGIRTALLGSLTMIALTMLIAVPIGLGAAIYLEEYAARNRVSQLIQTNITNLAGVPSIVYGMLGLLVFVRALGPITSGEAFGVTGGNGRTILSAALTMALLVLPLLIINAQEAIRAVPSSLRQAAYAIGGTKWEMIRDHVLPSAMPGILTGTILALSRALGETAPLIVVGASTFIVSDPSGPFSKFTVLPIQIYNWTAQPGEQYRNVAAAAILVLLVLLLTLNLFAIVLRNRYGKRGANA